MLIYKEFSKYSLLDWWFMPVLTILEKIKERLKVSQRSVVVRPIWLNGSLFVNELSGCGFESHCCHLMCSSLTKDDKLWKSKS